MSTPPAPDHDASAPVAEVVTHGYLCTGCPLGCRLEVDEAPDGDIVEVRGFSCRKGRAYAVQEHTDPRRLVTTTVAIDGASCRRLPVRTVEAVPKDVVLDVCRALAPVRLRAPVRLGEVVLADVCGTGIAVVATRTLPAVAPDAD